MANLNNISPVDSLVDLTRRDGADVRPALLRAVTDLYVQKPVHSDDETTQYVALALGLIDAVDEATRRSVAATLADYPAAPEPVLAKLNRSQAAMLTDETVPAITALPPVAFMPQPARDAGTYAATPATSEMAKDDDFVLPELLTDVFLDAPPNDRRLILFNLDIVSDPALLSPIASDDTVAQLEDAAMRQDTAAFARLMAQAIGIHPDLALRLTEDTGGEALVILAKALGIKATVLQRVLIFLNPAIGHSVERVFDLVVLHDELSLSAASHMVALWQQDAPAIRHKPRPEAAAYEPVYQDDARIVRRPLARDMRRPEPRETATPHKAAR